MEIVRGTIKMTNKFMDKVKYFMGLDDFVEEDDDDEIERTAEDEDSIMPINEIGRAHV